MQKETAWCNLKASELRQLATENAIVVVPIGSIEQHGPHLPVQVDALLAGEVCRRAAEYMADSVPVTVTPTIWSGLAEHHMSFGGTLTLDFDTFRSVIRCICRWIQQHGFMPIELINDHGGYIATLTVISLTAGRRAMVFTGDTGPDMSAAAQATRWRVMPAMAARFIQCATLVIIHCASASTR